MKGLVSSLVVALVVGLSSTASAAVGGLSVGKSSKSWTKTTTVTEGTTISQRGEGEEGEAAEGKAGAKEGEEEASCPGREVFGEVVHFDTGSAQLDADAQASLDDAASQLEGLSPHDKIRVEGYTDSVGGAQMNLGLSKERADAVASYLSEQGIDASKIEAVGLGENLPVAPNSFAAGKAENRRAELSIERGVAIEGGQTDG